MAKKKDEFKGIKIEDVVKAVTGFSAASDAITGSIKNIVKNITDAGKFDANKLKDSNKNLAVLTDSVDNFVELFNDIVKGFEDSMKNLDFKKLNKIMDAFLTTETPPKTEEKKQANGGSYIITTQSVKKPGMLDLINGILSINGTLSSLKMTNPIKFKIAYKQTLRLFDYMYFELMKTVDKYDANEVEKAWKTVDALTNMTSVIPALIDQLSQPLTKLGKNAKRIKLGMAVLIGSKKKRSKGDAGLIGDVVWMGDYLVKHPINSKSFDELKKVAVAIKGFALAMVLSMSIMAIAAPLIAIGMGITILCIKGFIFIAGMLSRHNRLFRHAKKEMLIIALTVMALASTALLLALTGVFIIKAWPAIAMTGAFVLGIIVMFVLVGLAAKFINRGGKELLIIAATVAILAMTAVLIGLVGQYIEAEWEQIAKCGALLLGIVGIFTLVGLAAKIINKGGKELFFVAATVAILAGVAVLMCVVGGLINAQWDGVLKMALLMTVLSGAMIAVGFAAKMIDKGAKTMLLMCVPIAAIVAAIAVIADVVMKTDMGKLWAGFGMMIAMLVAFGAAAIGLGVPPVAAFAEAGAAVMITLCVPIVMIAASMLAMANAIRIISSLNLDKDQVAEQMAIPIETTKSIIGMVDEIGILQVTAAAYKIGRLASISVSIGKMAQVLQKVASLNMPVEFDEHGNGKKWEQMKEEDFKSAALNCGAILSFFVTLFDDRENAQVEYAGGVVDIKPISKEALDKITWGTKWKIKRLRTIVSAIGDMATTMQEVASLSVPKFDEEGKETGRELMTKEHFEKAAINSASILEFFVKMFSNNASETVTFSGGTTEIHPITQDMLENITRSTKNKVKRLRTIVGAIGDMATTLQSVASLTVPMFDDQGKNIGERLMGKQDFIDAAENSAAILEFFVKMFSENDKETVVFKGGTVTFSPITESMLDNITRSTKKKMERLGVIVSPISTMATALKDTADMRIQKYDDDGKILQGETVKLGSKDISQASSNLKTILNCYVSAIAGIDEDKLDDAEDRVEDLEKVFKVLTPATNHIKEMIEVTKSLEGVTMYVKINNQVKTRLGALMEDYTKSIFSNIDSTGTMKASAFETAAKNTINMLEKVNKTDITKLKYAFSLVSKLNDFSRSINGNFDRLADTINHKLITALEKLEEVLKNTNENLNGINQQGNSPTVLSNFTSQTTVSDTKNNNNGKNSTTTQQINTLVDSINTLINEMSSGLTVKPAKGSKWPEI